MLRQFEFFYFFIFLLFGGIIILNNFFQLITDLCIFFIFFFMKIMNFLGSGFFKLVDFLLNNNNDYNNDYASNNEYNDEDTQSKTKDKSSYNYLNNIYSKIKNKLFINNDNNQELIFKKLKNHFTSNDKIDYKNDNQNNNINNFNDTFRTKNSFYEKYILTSLLDQNIQEKINIKIVIPLTVAILASLVLFSYIFIGFEISLAILLLGLIGLFLIFYFPEMEKKKKYSEISRELPYALRHMVTELKSGKGLHDTLNSIAIHEYGALSEEFSRVLEEIKYGENTETSLINMSKRVSSNGLDRTVQQIIGTLRTGGNLSNTLNIIAEDITHDLQMALKDYSQKLNALIKHYIGLYNYKY